MSEKGFIYSQTEHPAPAPCPQAPSYLSESTDILSSASIYLTSFLVTGGQHVRGAKFLEEVFTLHGHRNVGRSAGGVGVAHLRREGHIGVLDVWLEATAPPEPLHDIAGVDGRRRIIARRVCILAGEKGRLAMRLRSRRHRTRRRGGRGHSGDGVEAREA